MCKKRFINPKRTGLLWARALWARAAKRYKKDVQKVATCGSTLMGKSSESKLLSPIQLTGKRQINRGQPQMVAAAANVFESKQLGAGMLADLTRRSSSKTGTPSMVEEIEGSVLL